MADEQFDLGEALGGYEQAQADRNFYLSMMQQGNRNQGAFMASPIAVYLAGVAGVKMANMREKVQQATDERQAKKDAIAATERAQKRFDTLQNSMFNIAKAANSGEIAKGTAAAMYGHIVREAGGTPLSYDADNGILSYNLKGNDYEVDLSKIGLSKKDIEEGKNIRQEKSLKAMSERQERGIQGQKELAAYRKSLGTGSGSQNKYTTLSAFNSTHKDVLSALGRESRMNRLTFGKIKDFVDGIESLSPKDREQVESKVNDVLKYAQKKGWDLSSTQEATEVF